MAWNDDEMSRHRAHRLILGTAHVDRLATRHVVALAEEVHRRVGCRDRLADGLDFLVDAAEERLVPGRCVASHRVSVTPRTRRW